MENVMSEARNFTALPDLTSLITAHSLQTLYIGYNSFPCDCRMAWLYDIITSNHSVNVYMDSEPCTGELAGQVWVQMQRLDFCDLGICLLQSFTS